MFTRPQRPRHAPTEDTRSGRAAPSSRRFVGALALLALVVGLGSALWRGAGVPDASAQTATGPLRSYAVRLDTANLLALPRLAGASLAPAAEDGPAEEVARQLAQLAAEGLAGAYAADSALPGYRAELADSARDRLAAHPAVASIEPASASSADPPPAGLPPVRGAQAISSVSFVQVHSPFVWGRVSTGGLAVALTLEDGAGNVKGVPIQSYNAAPNDQIKIDITQLYYETVFVDPNVAAHPPVMIRPGDRVHVVTSGKDTSTGQPATDDRRIVVDDVRAWTSYERDTVAGVAPPNSSLVVTASGVDVSDYLTPGASQTYAEVTAAGDGSFAVGSMRTTASTVAKVVDMKQGVAGFVRVRHLDGNEVYTFHGQNVLVLENSGIVHGYAFKLPSVPAGLQAGVAAKRPSNTVTIALKDGGGTIKEAMADDVATNTSTPYVFELASPVSGGDRIEVSINGGPSTAVAAAPLSATVDLAGNQVVGTAPAGTPLVLGIGRVQGYLTTSSRADFLESRLPADGAGRFASGLIRCGTTNHLALGPGSFGYVGFEDDRGSFVYAAFAAPTNHVMSDYPFVEGWIADGTIRPSVTVRSAAGATTHESSVDAVPLYSTLDRLFFDVYYNLTTSQFVVPGDTVTVVGGARTDVVPVDRVTAFVDVDRDAVTGEAPSGAGIRVVPVDDRAARRELSADVNGSYRASNPYTTASSSSCAETPRTVDFTPGDAGRAYVRHADGNEVFAAYGRAVHVVQHDNFVELYVSVLRDLDWPAVARREVTVTLTPRQGAPTVSKVMSEGTRAGRTRFNLVDASGQKAIIRGGDTLTASFDEGPVGLTRPVVWTLAAMPLITASPDLDSSTVAGIGPREWGGRATLNPPPTVKAAPIESRLLTAYGPLAFVDSAGRTVPMAQGYSGTASFSNAGGQRIWTAWAVTAYPVKILGMPKPGETVVCGTAAAGTSVRIYDASDETNVVVIGSGTTDAQKNFCVSVTPLTRGQVILAEADGTYSQPLVVSRERIFVQIALRSAATS